MEAIITTVLQAGEFVNVTNFFPILELVVNVRILPLEWRHDTQHNDNQHNSTYIATLRTMTLRIMAEYCNADCHLC